MGYGQARTGFGPDAILPAVTLSSAQARSSTTVVSSTARRSFVSRKNVVSVWKCCSARRRTSWGRRPRGRGTSIPSPLRSGTVVGSAHAQSYCCLLYTSDAADDLLCVDLG